MAYESGIMIALKGERLARLPKRSVPEKPVSDARRAQPKASWGQFGAVISLASRLCWPKGRALTERFRMAGRCRNLLRFMDAGKWSNCCVSWASREAWNSVLDELDSACFVAVESQFIG